MVFVCAMHHLSFKQLKIQENILFAFSEAFQVVMFKGYIFIFIYYIYLSSTTLSFFKDASICLTDLGVFGVLPPLSQQHWPQSFH